MIWEKVHANKTIWLPTLHYKDCWFGSKSSFSPFATKDKGDDAHLAACCTDQYTGSYSAPILCRLELQFTLSFRVCLWTLIFVWTLPFTTMKTPVIDWSQDVAVYSAAHFAVFLDVMMSATTTLWFLCMMEHAMILDVNCGVDLNTIMVKMTPCLQALLWL